MDRWFDKQDERWRALPLERQRRYTLYLFAGYLLLTAGVILKVCYDMAKSDNKMVIEHIDNPVLKKRKSCIPEGHISNNIRRKDL